MFRSQQMMVEFMRCIMHFVTLHFILSLYDLFFQCLMLEEVGKFNKMDIGCIIMYTFWSLNQTLIIIKRDIDTILDQSFILFYFFFRYTIVYLCIFNHWPKKSVYKLLQVRYKGKNSFLCKQSFTISFLKKWLFANKINWFGMFININIISKRKQHFIETYTNTKHM